MTNWSQMKMDRLNKTVASALEAELTARLGAGYKVTFNYLRKLIKVTRNTPTNLFIYAVISKDSAYKGFLHGYDVVVACFGTRKEVLHTIGSSIHNFIQNARDTKKYEDLL